MILTFSVILIIVIVVITHFSNVTALTTRPSKFSVGEMASTTASCAPVSDIVGRFNPLMMTSDSKDIEQVGKTRRMLRSIAARMMRNEAENPDSPSKLTILSINQLDGVVNNQPFIENMSQQLKAKELLKLKVTGKGLKKKDVKEMGVKLSAQTGSEVVQVLGHSLLFFKESSSEGVVTSQLRKELRG